MDELLASFHVHRDLFVQCPSISALIPLPVCPSSRRRGINEKTNFRLLVEPQLLGDRLPCWTFERAAGPAVMIVHVIIYDLSPSLGAITAEAG